MKLRLETGSSQLKNDLEVYVTTTQSGVKIPHWICEGIFRDKSRVVFLAYPCETDLVSVLEVLNILMMFRDLVFEARDFRLHTCTLMLLWRRKFTHSSWPMDSKSPALHLTFRVLVWQNGHCVIQLPICITLLNVLLGFKETRECRKDCPLKKMRWPSFFRLHQV